MMSELIDGQMYLVDTGHECWIMGWSAEANQFEPWEEDDPVSLAEAVRYVPLSLAIWAEELCKDCDEFSKNWKRTEYERDELQAENARLRQALTGMIHQHEFDSCKCENCKSALDSAKQALKGGER